MLDISNLILWVPGLLLALTVHEYSHGRVAFALGDPTAQRAGRLTLNPLSHLDLMGTIAIFLFHIGWAKPVPINPYFFKKPRRDMILVSLAGPAANLAAAIVSGIFLKILTMLGQYNRPLWLMFLYMMDINVILMVFNLIPIPPLDGSKVLFNFARMSESTIYNMERIGPPILFAVIFLGALSGFNILWMIIQPAVFAFHLIFT